VAVITVYSQDEPIYYSQSNLAYMLADLLRKSLRTWLGINELEEKSQSLEEDIISNSQDFERNESLINSNAKSIKRNKNNIQDHRQAIRENRKKIRDMQPLAVDLTERQRDVLNVFLNADNDAWIGAHKISQKLDTSRNNAGSIMSDLKKKVDFDSQTVENGKKLYKLPDTEREKIFSR